jgi:hypothetical protein
MQVFGQTNTIKSMTLNPTYSLTLNLLVSAIQACALQTGSGKNISTTCNTPLQSKTLAVSKVQ